MQGDVEITLTHVEGMGNLNRRSTDTGARPTRVGRSLVWSSVCGAVVTALLAVTVPEGAIGRIAPCPRPQEPRATVPRAPGCCRCLAC
jgi:hypothetical protein